MVFEEIYQQFAAKVYRMCIAYVNDEDLAKDLTQDTFTTVWQNLHTFRNESAIGTWVYRIAANKCLRSIEQTKRVRNEELPLELADVTSSNQEENIKMLYKCISELEEIDRIIISLELDEIPQSSIATITGLSEGNVRVKIHRIKGRLLEKMKKYENL